MLSIHLEKLNDPPYSFGGFSWNAYVNGVLDNHQMFTLLCTSMNGSETQEISFSNSRPIQSSHQNQFGDRNCRHDQTNGIIKISSIQTAGEITGVGGLVYPKLVYILGPDRSDRYPLDISKFYDIRWGDEDALYYGRVVAYPAERASYYGIDYYRNLVYRRLNDSTWLVSSWSVQYDANGIPLRWGSATPRRSTWPSPINDWSQIDPYYTPNFSNEFSNAASRIGISDLSSDHLRFDPHILEYYLKLAPEIHPDLQEVYGPLAEDIVSSASFPQVNLPAYFRDLFKTGEDVLKLARSVARADIKSLSDSYLSYKYGMTLTVNDTLKIGAGLVNRASNLLWQSRKASSSRPFYWRFGKATVSYAYKVYYSLQNQESSDLIDDLFSADILGLGNTWDLIPFSFVADWFVGIGDFLESLDNTVLYNTLPVISTVASVKAVAEISDPAILAKIVGSTTGLIEGAVSISYYSRAVLPELITPKIAWESPSDFNHFLEAGALIVSTRYKR